MKKYDDVEYTDEEYSIIIKLEEYAEILSNLINDIIDDINYEEFYKLLDSLSELDIDDKIKKYGEYLRGASIPLYENSLKNIEFEENNDVNDLVNSNYYWCDLEKDIEKNNINIVELTSKLNMGLDNSKYSWSFLIGYYHCLCIYKNHMELKKYQE